MHPPAPPPEGVTRQAVNSRTPAPGRQGRVGLPLGAGGCRGSVSAETAVVLPAVLLLILLIVQTAFYAHARNLTQSAADEGLRAARLRTGSAAAGQSAAARFLAATAGTLLTGTAVSSSRGPATATITVEANAVAVVPFLHLSVHGTATGPVERFVPAPPDALTR